MIRRRNALILTGSAIAAPLILPRRAFAAYSGPGDIASIGTPIGFWGFRAVTATKASGAPFAAIDVQPPGGGTATPINILTTGAIDSSTLSSYIGANGGAICSKIYDQIGSNHFTQSTVANMPNVGTDASTATTKLGTGQYCLMFTGAQFMTASGLTTLANYTGVSFAVRTGNFTTPQGQVWSMFNSVGAQGSFIFNNAANQGLIFASNSVTFTANDQTWHGVGFNVNGASGYYAIDGATNFPQNVGSNSPDGGGSIRLGTSGSNNFIGQWCEGAWWSGQVGGGSMNVYSNTGGTSTDGSVAFYFSAIVTTGVVHIRMLRGIGQ
jgi:hypothetical protein